MSNFRGWELIILLLAALLLFGGFKKLPDAARGLGRSLRIFKSETKGLADDEQPAASEQDAVSPDPSAAPAPTSDGPEHVTADAKNPTTSA